MSKHNDRFIRNHQFIFRQVVDEMILVPLHNHLGDMDAIYTLNEVGAFLWKRMESPVTVDELLRAILDTFDGNPDEVLADLMEFLRTMEECGAVERR